MIDKIYEYAGFHHREKNSRCQLQINGNVVMVTELDDNPGTSVTNMAEQLATLICQEFSIDPASLIWIEHYPERGSKYDTYPEDFDLVTFTWDGRRFIHPQWKRIIGEVAEKMIGVSH